MSLAKDDVGVNGSTGDLERREACPAEHTHARAGRNDESGTATALTGSAVLVQLELGGVDGLVLLPSDGHGRTAGRPRWVVAHVSRELSHGDGVERNALSGHDVGQVDKQGR